MKMWRNLNPHILLVGKWNELAAEKNSLVPQRTIWPINFIPRCIPPNTDTTIQTNPYVAYSQQHYHNSQKVGRALCPSRDRKAKEQIKEK